MYEISRTNQSVDLNFYNRDTVDLLDQEARLEQLEWR